ncbi:MAG: MFS transporter [Xanthomonadaceae bacterium]|nr:MFS transporter [Xanthomonadaceae bacterium]
MPVSAPSLARRGAAFGLLAAAASGPGQTFFIGLFGASFRADFGLSSAALGVLYGAATLGAGLLMFWLGALADRLAPGRAMALALAVLGAGALLVAGADTALPLVAGLFLLRLGGQGLAGHFAIVVAARFGGAARGRTIAVAAMGFMLAEATFPLLVTAALGSFGWRAVWVAVPIALIALALPALLHIGRPFPAPTLPGAQQADDVSAVWTRRRLLRAPQFVGALGTVLVPAFVVTALFFHQTALAEQFGWTPSAVARAFIVYAGCQAAAIFIAGQLVDRFSARALVPVYLLPLAGGVLATVVAPPAAALWLLFAGLGVTAGANSVLAGALWVELFGSRSIGLVRGMYAGCMVLSSAVSPALLGALLSADVAAPLIFIPVAAYAALMPLLLRPLLRG